MFHKVLLTYTILILLLHKALIVYNFSFIILIGLFGIIVFSILQSTLQGKSVISYNKNDIYLGLYLLIISISLFRSYMNGLFEISPIFTIMGVYFITYFYFLYVRTNKELNYKKLIFSGLNLYLLINLILYSIGYESPHRIILSDTFGENATLKIFGISHERILFPLAPNIQSYGLICGSLLLYNLIIYRKNKNIYNIFFVLIATISLILTDSRGQILFLIIILFIYIFFNNFFLKRQFFFIITYIFSVFYIVVIIYSIYSFFDIELLVRENSVTIFSGRELIWIEFLTHYRPTVFDALFGYGNDGHVISGISKNYSYLFTNWLNPESASVHNNSFQLILDIGFIGLGLLYFIIYRTIQTYREHYFFNKNPLNLAAIYILNYLLISGTTEGVLNPENSFTILILIILIVFTSSK